MGQVRILIIGLTLILTACGPTSIDEIKKDKLTFDSLPDTVQNIYETEAKKKKTDFEYVVISTDRSISFEHEHTGMDDGIWTLTTRGFNHHFYIDGKHFKLQANQGNPFILHHKHLYYTLELNLADYNYKEAEYMSVDLQEYMK
jgi:hypothetical protein